MVDSTPVAGSTRPVTSSGIKNYVNTKVANAVVPSGIQIFKSSGTLTVPHGVNCVKVRLCGGGGGGGTVSFSNDPKYGGTGGTSSFGSYVSATEEAVAVVLIIVGVADKVSGETYVFMAKMVITVFPHQRMISWASLDLEELPTKPSMVEMVDMQKKTLPVWSVVQR